MTAEQACQAMQRGILQVSFLMQIVLLYQWQMVVKEL